MRMCVATRESVPKAELVRWFVGPDHTHWPDWTGATENRFGKGVYTLRTKTAIQTAIQRRFLKGDKDVLLERVQAAAERAFKERLGLACRANAMAIGQTAIRDALRKEWTRGVYMYAADAGPSGVERTRSHAKHLGAAIVQVRDGETIGHAVGRQFVSSIWCKESVFSRNFQSWALGMQTLDTFVLSMETSEQEKINRLEGPALKD